MDLYPFIIQTAGSLGQVFLTHLHHHLVNFHQVDPLDLRVPDQLPDNSTVSCSNDQHLLHMGVYCHRNMGDHLMVDKLILFRQHHITVKSQEAPELRGLKHIDPLEITVAAVKLPVNPDRQLHILCLFFRKPKIHVYTPFSTLRWRISRSSAPVKVQPFSLAYSICSRIS